MNRNSKVLEKKLYFFNNNEEKFTILLSLPYR